MTGGMKRAPRIEQAASQTTSAEQSLQPNILFGNAFRGKVSP